MTWVNLGNMPPKDYKCGYCGSEICSEKGYANIFKGSTRESITSSVYICHKCGDATYFANDGRQYPGSAYGMEVAGIYDKKIEGLYEEARNCISVNAFTAAVMCCRKLLMHIAVSKGAAENQGFIAYVEYLLSKNYVPPDAREWVDHIRQMSNEANHKIEIMDE